MIRLVAFLLVVLAFATGLHWLADRPGTITIEWLGYIAETSMFRALIILAVVLTLAFATWSLLRQAWRSPATVGRYLYRRRQKRGLDALTSGIIAVGAGDRALAVRYAAQARKALPHEPLTHLLRAQAAQIGGDRATARRIFEAMLASPETEQLGLRGLFLEAEREGETEAARQFAERALQRNAKLDWPVEALFELQCRAQDWQAALDTLAIARRQHLIEKAPAARRRAVLLTAQAQALEDADADKALELAQEAHRLAPNLVPAAAIAGRVLAARGNTPRAARVLLKTWRLAPHPDLAAAYAYARPGDSPRDRLNRVRHLARITPNHPEAQIAVAISAIDARDWNEARRALEPLLDDRLTPRVCTLMARIEGERNSDAGRVREWLARAANAARDPAWTADGVVSDHWSAVSPVTGALDAFQWRAPVEAGSDQSAASLAAKVEALIALGSAAEARTATARTQPPPTQAPAAIAVPPGPRPAAAPARTLPPAAVVTPPQAAPPAPAPKVAPPLAERHIEPDEILEPTDAPYRQRTASTPAPKPQPAPKPALPPSQPRVRKPAEPKIFVPPHAPDDPGPEPAEDDFSAYPPSGAKA
jgi:HemY protein